jgi:small subunit ribosomal protein S8
MVTDPVADMLTRIRNALRIKAEKVDIPASRMKVEIARVLKEEGFIKTYKILRDKRQGILRVVPRYVENESVISGLKRISTPGRRVFVSKREIPRVMGGVGIAILTTSKGILSDKGSRHEGIGGEVICYVW